MVLWGHGISGSELVCTLLSFASLDFLLFTLRPCPEPGHMTLDIIALEKGWWCEIREHESLTVHIKLKSHFMCISKLCEEYLRSQVFPPWDTERESYELRRWDIGRSNRRCCCVLGGSSSLTHCPCGGHVLGEGQQICKGIWGQREFLITARVGSGKARQMLGRYPWRSVGKAGGCGN